MESMDIDEKEWQHDHYIQMVNKNKYTSIW